jgi:hypothetical protein
MNLNTISFALVGKPNKQKLFLWHSHWMDGWMDEWCKQLNLDVKNIFAGSHTKYLWGKLLSIINLNYYE